MRTMPVPRVVYLLADMTVWLVVVLPGVVFAVIVAALRFGLDLEISPLVVPAILLVVLTATSVGYTMASLLPPMVAQMASQILVVFILMFSPLNFPADRLPGWLATIHSILPIQAMGELMRGTLASNTFPLTTGAFLLLGAWCAATFAATSLVLTRRA
jgi:ABC-2 type transport system permease protein